MQIVLSDVGRPHPISSRLEYIKKGVLWARNNSFFLAAFKLGHSYFPSFRLELKHQLF